MNTKTGLYLVIFLILGISTFLYLNKGDHTSSFKSAENDFAVEDPNQIHKIFFADRGTKRVTLVRNGDHWIYNDDYKARPNAIKLLLDVFTKVTVREHISKAAEANIIRELAGEGIKVELYDKNNRPLKIFYVGTTTNDNLGTHMIMENSETPYIMHLRSWEGSLRTRFFLDEKNWRDRSIYDENPEEITEVSIEYPKQRDESFTVKKEQGKFIITPFYETTKKIDATISQKKVESYLTGFESKIAEAFETEHLSRDSIIRTLPFATISLKKKNKNLKTVRLFPIHGRQVAIRADGTPRYTETERYFAMINDNEDFMLVQHRVFKPLFWGYKSFFEKEKLLK